MTEPAHVVARARCDARARWCDRVAMCHTLPLFTHCHTTDSQEEKCRDPHPREQQRDIGGHACDKERYRDTHWSDGDGKDGIQTQGRTGIQ